MTKKRMQRISGYCAWSLSVLTALLMLAGFGGRAYGECPVPVPVKPKTDFQLIEEGLKSGDATARGKAMELIWRQLDENPTNAVRELRMKWSRLLIQAKRNQEVADLAVEAAMAAPAESAALEDLFVLRTQALLALGKPDEALVSAKSAFNISGMAGTSRTLQVMAECLRRTHPNEPLILDRFRREQAAAAGAAVSDSPGAAPEPGEARPEPAKPLAKKAESSPPPPSGYGTSLLVKGIAVNGAAYRKRLSEIQGDDYRAYTARGNLLLLADSPAEARVMFEYAYSLAIEKDMTAATENLVRCVKAEDGGIGRANAWVLSLRPPPKSAPGGKSPTVPEKAPVGETAEVPKGKP